jgi:hypothetical protein
MPSMRSSAAAFTVALLCAAFGSAAHAARSPGKDATRVAGPRDTGVYLDHVMIENPNLIIPCVRVFRSVLNESRRNASLHVTLELSWYSGEVLQQGTFTVPLSEFERAHHHEGSKDTNYVLTETHLELDAAIDEGTEVVGTATLNERGATPTAVRFLPGS